MAIQVKPSGAALGAEITGADLTQPLDDAAFAQIRAKFYQPQHKATFDYPATLPRLMHRTTVINGAAGQHAWRFGNTLDYGVFLF